MKWNEEIFDSFLVLAHLDLTVNG